MKTKKTTKRYSDIVCIDTTFLRNCNAYLSEFTILKLLVSFWLSAQITIKKRDRLFFGG